MLRVKTILICAGTALIHWILWLAYTNNIGFREIIAGGIATGIATFAAYVFARQGKVRFAFCWRDVVQAVYLPWYAVQGTWQVLVATAQAIFTAKGVDSSTVAVRFDVGADNLLDRGRRALAVSYVTITPSSVALGLCLDQKLLLYHQITSDKVPAMLRHLGARP